MGFQKFQSYRYVKEYQNTKVYYSYSFLERVFLSLGYTFIVVSILVFLAALSPWILATTLNNFRYYTDSISAIESRLSAVRPKFGDLAFNNQAQSAVIIPTPTNIPNTPVPTPTPTPDPASLYFAIRIPKLNVQSIVIPNVDINNTDEYTKALKRGVAHTYGTAFPNQSGMTFIFGHSTDYIWNVETYNALFYQIKDLISGDLVILDYGDKSYQYKVREIRVIEAHDLSFVKEFENKNVLIIQTCYPPGTTWQRLIVIAEPVWVQSLQ